MILDYNISVLIDNIMFKQNRLINELMNRLID